MQVDSLMQLGPVRAIIYIEQQGKDPRLYEWRWSVGTTGEYNRVPSKTRGVTPLLT